MSAERFEPVVVAAGPGPRSERGYRRVGYTWFAGADLSLLSYTAPSGDQNYLYLGYVRRAAAVSR